MMPSFIKDGGMDEARKVIVGGVGALLRGSWLLAGVVLWAMLFVSWCLLVFLVSGRLPWMVRKYL